MKSNQFGKTIAIRRKMKGLTQEMLASELGITPQAVSKWESGIGYPDVSLLPEIADILDITIDKLFDADAREPGFPLSDNGLAFIDSDGLYGCYSDKELERRAGSVLYFTDQSTADFESREVVNTGNGEIRFVKKEDNVPGAGENRTAHTEAAYTSASFLMLSVAQSCDCVIHNEGEKRIVISGTERFISLVKITEDKKALSIDVKSADNRAVGDSNTIDIYGVEPGERFRCSISGCGNVTLNAYYEDAELTIAGSGDISCDTVGNISISIAGSGDVSCASSNEAAVRIAGSGDVCLGNVTGRLAVAVSGSGDISAGGNVDTLDVVINGSGDFGGENLTAREAAVRIAGSGDVLIGRVIERSKESISASGSLRVIKRG